jgi:hypothetical protein
MILSALRTARKLRISPNIRLYHASSHLQARRYYPYTLSAGSSGSSNNSDSGNMLKKPAAVDKLPKSDVKKEDTNKDAPEKKEKEPKEKEIKEDKPKEDKPKEEKNLVVKSRPSRQLSSSKGAIDGKNPGKKGISCLTQTLHLRSRDFLPSR